MPSSLPRSALALSLLTALVLPQLGCTCDPGSTSADPTCGDLPQSASLTITASLDGIRPVGTPKQIRVRGTRLGGESLCFAPGGELSFSETIKGTGDQTLPIKHLAAGQWEFQVSALSGGGHDVPPKPAKLVAGASHTLSITSDAAGDIKVNVAP